MKISRSELIELTKEETKKIILNELGPQHDFRAEPEERAKEFIDYLGEELRGVVDAHISLDPIDRRSGRYNAVIEIPERDMKRSRLDWEELKKRVKSVARGGDGIVQEVHGVDVFEPGNYSDLYGFEIPFLA